MLEVLVIGTTAFINHESSACYAEAVEAIVALPASTGDVGEQLSSDLEVVCDTYKDDFDKDLLSTQLSVLGTNFNKSIFDVKDYMLTISPYIFLQNIDLYCTLIPHLKLITKLHLLQDIDTPTSWPEQVKIACYGLEPCRNSPSLALII